MTDEARKGEQEKRFPIQYGRKDVPGPTTIPWSVADVAYSAYRARYGDSQSLETIAKRQGFGAAEMDALHPGWRDASSEILALRQQLRERDETIARQKNELIAAADVLEQIEARYPGLLGNILDRDAVLGELRLRWRSPALAESQAGRHQG